MLAVLACGLSSCSDSFLEVTPKGKLIADQTADYDLLLNNKALLELFLNGQVQAYLGDELDAINPYFDAGYLRSKRLFSYTDVIYERNENAEEITDLMKNLYTYNKIINEVMDSQNGSEAQKKAIRAKPWWVVHGPIFIDQLLRQTLYGCQCSHRSWLSHYSEFRCDANDVYAPV